MTNSGRRPLRRVPFVLLRIGAAVCALSILSTNALNRSSRNQRRTRHGSRYRTNSNQQDRQDYMYYNYADYIQNSRERQQLYQQQQQQQQQQQSSDVIMIQCYSCQFQVELDIPMGLGTCNDPFSTIDIPLVPCPGHCSKTFRKLEKNQDFALVRGCLKGCRDHRTTTSYTECCETSLCNGYSGTSKSRTLSLTALLYCFLPIIVTCLAR